MRSRLGGRDDILSMHHQVKELVLYYASFILISVLMAAKSAPRWMTTVAYVAFALGGIFLVIELVQRVSDVQLLEKPWSGTVGMWLLAFVLSGLAKRSGRAASGGAV